MTTRSASALLVSSVRTSASRPVVLARIRHSRQATSSGAPIAITTIVPPITMPGPAGRALERGEADGERDERHDGRHQRQPDGEGHASAGEVVNAATARAPGRRHRPCPECVTAHWEHDARRRRWRRATRAGPDALSYLQGQVSQDLLPMAVGDRRWTFLLQPTGKVEVLAAVTRSGEDEFVFDTDAGYGDLLAARLARFKIRVKVDIGPVDAARRRRVADEAARIEAGWPAMGAEIVPGETIPAETGVTDAVSSVTSPSGLASPKNSSVRRNGSPTLQRTPPSSSA